MLGALSFCSKPGSEKAIKHCLMIIICFVFGLSLSLTGYKFSHEYIEQEHLNNLQKAAAERIYAIKAESENLVDIVYSLSGFFRASNYVDSKEFHTFFETAFPNNKHIISMFSWIPRVTADKTEDFIRNAKIKDGYDNFSIVLNDKRNYSHHAGSSDAYPFYHQLVNDEGHRTIRGLDLLSHFSDPQVLLQSRDTGRIISSLVATHSHDLVLVEKDKQKHAEGSTLEMYLPVYRPAEAPQSVENRRRTMLGFLGLHVDLSTFMENTLRSHVANAGGLDIYLFDKNNKRVFFHASRSRHGERNFISGEVYLGRLLHGLYAEQTLNIANQEFKLILKPIPGFYDASTSTIPLVVFLMSMVLVLLIISYYYNASRNFQLIENTVQKRTAELDNNRKQTKAILNAVVDGILTIDQDGIVRSSNPAFRKIFNYLNREVEGSQIASFILDEDREKVMSYLNELTMSQEESDEVNEKVLEVTGLRPDGGLIPVEIILSKMGLNDNALLTCTIRDISERKKVDRLKNEFISTVSHELRTPLTSIRGALRLVLTKASVGMTEKARKMLETADRNSERLTLLINDILDIEKIESGKLEFDFKPLDVVELTKCAIESNMQYATQHNIGLELVDDPGDVMVWGDEHRLLQVFANLLSNAIKFSRSGQNVEVSISVENERIKFDIRDYGEGIPENFRSKIFQRFAQVDSTDSRQKGGTGLGLNITKAIVTRHDGTIGFQSTEGQGTSFYFELPVWKKIIRFPDDKKHKYTALICEDNIDTANALSQVLANENIACDIAVNIYSARTLMLEKNYDLMLLDITLPDGNGLKFLKEVRDNERFSKLPVIIVSGNAQDERKGNSTDFLNIVDWLQKPVEKSRLDKALDNAIVGRHQQRVLHIEDDIDIIQVTKELLEDTVHYSYASTYKDACKLLQDEVFDLVILDLVLPDGSGIDLLNILKNNCSVIILSGLEPSANLSNQVAAALTKSRTSNDQLLETIKHVLNDSEDQVAYG